MPEPRTLETIVVRPLPPDDGPDNTTDDGPNDGPDDGTDDGSNEGPDEEDDESESEEESDDEDDAEESDDPEEGAPGQLPTLERTPDPTRESPSKSEGSKGYTTPHASSL